MTFFNLWLPWNRQPSQSARLDSADEAEQSLSNNDNSNSNSATPPPINQRLTRQESVDIIEIKGDESGNEEEVKNMNLTSWDMWALGMTIVIGGQFYSWNEGLTAGFGSFIIAFGVIALGYICLVFCVSELSSAIPFPGNNSYFFV